MLAKILEIGTEASAATRTYPVTLEMEQPSEIEILPGMAGKAMGFAREPGSTETVDIVVPVAAVFSPGAGENSYVWLIDDSDNTVGRVEVVVGNLVSTGIEIKSGLRKGDLIATAGVNFLTDGQEVRPKTD
ncbi:MAG: hypothetical protein V7709_01705 [Halioglobus sp.]